MHVYPSPNQENYYAVYPKTEIIKILNSDFFMWFILFATVSAVIGIIYGILWLHDMPKKKFHNLGFTQIALINVLTLLGWIYHQYWILALIIAFIDWPQLENTIVRILRRAKMAKIDDPFDPENAKAKATITHPTIAVKKNNQSLIKKSLNYTKTIIKKLNNLIRNNKKG